MIYAAEESAAPRRQGGVAMDPDMKVYDLEHVCTGHPVMTEDEHLEMFEHSDAAMAAVAKAKAQAKAKSEAKAESAKHVAAAE